MAGAQPKLELHTFSNVPFSDLKQKTWIILRLGKHNFTLHAFALTIHQPPYHRRDVASVATQCSQRKLQMARTFYLRVYVL